MSDKRLRELQRQWLASNDPENRERYVEELHRHGRRQDDRFPFDFDTFFDLVLAAARTAFTQVREQHPEEEVCGYALYSCSDITHLIPAANSRSRVNAERERNYAWAEWHTGEWAYEAQCCEPFEPANELLQAQSKTVWEATNGAGNSELYHEFLKRIIEVALRAMETLIAEGFFGTEREREDLVLLFTYSDASQPEEEFLRWMRRLNTDRVVERYLALAQG